MEINAKETANSGSDNEQYHSIATYRPRRTIRPPEKYGFEDSISYALITNNSDPITFQDIVDSQEKSKWIEAMMEKIESLYKNDT